MINYRVQVRINNNYQYVNIQAINEGLARAQAQAMYGSSAVGSVIREELY